MERKTCDGVGATLATVSREGQEAHGGHTGSLHNQTAS